MNKKVQVTVNPVNQEETMCVNICEAYGMDLVGQNSERGAIAKVTKKVEHIDGKNEIIIRAEIVDYLPASPEKTIGEIAQADIDFLIKNKYFPLVIDAPIEEQKCVKEDWMFPWETEFRDVDKFFVGRSPGQLGFLPLRAREILSKMANSTALGTELFESYPAASISESMEEFDREYSRDNIRWYKKTVAQWTKNKRKVYSMGANENGTRFEEILAAFKVEAGQEGLILTDDEFDAILCAITLLEQSPDCIFAKSHTNNKAYKRMVADKKAVFSHRKNKNTNSNYENDQVFAIPSGYRLITNKYWKSIIVTRKSRSSILEDVEKFLQKQKTK